MKERDKTIEEPKIEHVTEFQQVEVDELYTYCKKKEKDVYLDSN